MGGWEISSDMRGRTVFFFLFFTINFFPPLFIKLGIRSIIHEVIILDQPPKEKINDLISKIDQINIKNA